MLLHALPDAPSRPPLFSNDLPLYLYHVEGECRGCMLGVCRVCMQGVYGVYGVCSEVVFRGVFGIYMVHLHV
jgi:hypothetical protein